MSFLCSKPAKHSKNAVFLQWPNGSHMLPTITASPITLSHAHPTSQHTGPAHQGCSNLEVFVLVVPSAWNALPTDISLANSSLPSVFAQMSFSQ